MQGKTSDLSKEFGMDIDEGSVTCSTVVVKDYRFQVNYNIRQLSQFRSQ